MTTEELLLPRYKVIAGFPGNELCIGDIIQFKYCDSCSVPIAEDEYHVKRGDAYYDQYPHLFKRMEWWEERNIKDMPEYVKWQWQGLNRIDVEKVVEWVIDPFDSIMFYVQGGERLFSSCFQPATREEYEAGKSTQHFIN